MALAVGAAAPEPQYGIGTRGYPVVAPRPHSLESIWSKKILFRYGELIRLSPGGGGRCGRERGMGGQDGLRAGADAR